MVITLVIWAGVVTVLLGSAREGHPGLPQIRLERVLDRLVGAAAAELLDGELGVLLLQGRDRVEAGLQVLVEVQLVAGNFELDERRMTVLGDRAAVALEG